MRYCCYDAEVVSLGNDTALVRPRGGGEAVVLRPPEVDVVLACLHPGERNVQLARALQSARGRTAAPAGPKHSLPSLEELGRILDDLVERGVITGEDALVLHVAGSAPAEAPGRIASLGIPSRGRPAVLARALASFLEADRAWGRSTEVVVLDDNEQAADRRRYRAALERIGRRFGRELRHASRSARIRYARLLADRAGVPYHVVHYALLGNGCGPCYGAARNALLLDSVGSLCLQMDDDIVWQPARPPESSEGLEISARMDPHEYWFAAGLDEVQSALRPYEADLLQLHESCLGRRPRDCVAEARAAGLTVSLADAECGSALQPDARVVTSVAGIAGDCGGPGRHHQRLLAPRGAFERLVGDPRSYAARIASRQLIKCATRLTLSTSPYFMAGNAAFDNRALLPPFPPVCLGEDLVFGTLRRGASPASCGAFLPLTLLHDPSAFRANQSIQCPGLVYANSLTAELIAAFARCWPVQEPELYLPSVGRYVTSVGLSEPGDFRAQIARLATPSLRAWHNGLSAMLDARVGAPEFWKQDVRDALRQHLEQARREDAAVPADLSGSSADRIAAYRDLLVRFGEVLCAWPALVEAARQLCAAEVRLSQPIRWDRGHERARAVLARSS